MNIQIIYIAIYRALECVEEETQNEEMKLFLDMANPYIFKDRKSADPVIFSDYEQWINNNKIEITEESSYEVAARYIAENTDFSDFFLDISEEEWYALIAIIKKEEPHLN